jgi:lysophospholipase L1-like esterase
MAKKFIFTAILVVVSSLFAVGMAEGILRIKNSSMKNYDIEMWRYAKELKYQSPDPVLGHEHVKNASALLQSVTIRTNDWGLRGGPVAPQASGRRILFLGSSITLGWGVPEEKTVTAVLEKMLRAQGQNAEVLNAGIGNYNAERYVELFQTRLEGLHPTDIVVMYFVRDAEKLDAGGGNWLLRNSELAVTGWIAGNRLLNKSGEASLEDHYRAVYDESQPGYVAMKDSLAKLAAYAKQNNIHLYLAMIPDVHKLENYPLGYIHERVRQIAQADGYRYVDTLPEFGHLSPDQVWAMPGDPHPNALGHELMAKAIFPLLAADK